MSAPPLKRTIYNSKILTNALLKFGPQNLEEHHKGTDKQKENYQDIEALAKETRA